MTLDNPDFLAQLQYVSVVTVLLTNTCDIYRHTSPRAALWARAQSGDCFSQSEMSWRQSRTTVPVTSWNVTFNCAINVDASSGRSFRYIYVFRIIQHSTVTWPIELLTESFTDNIYGFLITFSWTEIVEFQSTGSSPQSTRRHRAKVGRSQYDDAPTWRRILSNESMPR